MSLGAVQREVCELCWALCDGALDDAGHERLEALVRDDAVARRTYVEFMFLRGGLLWDKAAAGMPTPLACPKPVEPRRLPSRRRALFVAAGLAAAILCGLGLWWRIPLPRRVANLALAPSGVVLAREYQSRWGGIGSPEVGQTLRPGRWTITHGVVELHLAQGSRVVVTAPSVIDILSPRRVALPSGQLTADIRHPQGLCIETPLATIIDVGTRFAVESSPEAVEVHVVEGAVDVRSRPDGVESADALRVDREQACRVALGEREPRLIDARPDRFAWEVPRIAPGDPDLLAYEGFDYRGPLLAAGNGGLGWRHGWAGFDDLVRPSTALLEDRASLASEDLRLPTLGGHVAEDVNDWGFRELAQPLDLGRDCDYYISFLFRKLNPGQPGQGRWAGLSLFEGPAERAFFGTQDGGFRIAQLGQPTEQGRLEPGVTYFFVARLSARAAEPDQAQLQVYEPGEEIDFEEPVAWDVVGSSDTRLEGQLDRIRIASETGYEIDEIRVGLSWAAVTQASGETASGVEAPTP